MQVNYFKEQGNNIRSIGGLLTWDKICHFGKSINHNKYKIKAYYVLGNPSTNSMLKSSQGLVGIGNGVYNPIFALK